MLDQRKKSLEKKNFRCVGGLLGEFSAFFPHVMKYRGTSLSIPSQALFNELII